MMAKACSGTRRHNLLLIPVRHAIYNDLRLYQLQISSEKRPAGMPIENASWLDLPQRVQSDLDKYTRAVFSEMYFLRDEGGHEYKVVNGERVSYVGGNVAYCFDVEAELFLAVDSPIKLKTSIVEAKGTVLSSEDFQITIVLEKDIGEKVSTAYIRAEPWQLLEALNERVKMVSRHNTPLAAKLLNEGPTLATKRPLTEIDTGQDEALTHVLNDPITVIWGPPGTGKTHTMAEIAIRFITAGKKVLVVSHSNISVDGVAAKVAELMRARGMNDILKRGKVMRFGHVRDANLTNDPEVVSYNYALMKDPKRVQELKDLNEKRRRLMQDKRGRNSEMVKVQQRIKEIRKGVVDEEQRCVKKADLVATTVSKLYVNSLFDDEKYDLVMFDEVSMAYVPQIIAAATYSRGKLVLVGDFRQLAPIAQGKASKEMLSHDIFSYLGICDERQEVHYHPWLVLLNEQRRMHPDISRFSNKAFYSGLIKDHESVVEGRNAIAKVEPFRRKAMTLLSVSGLSCASTSNSDNSRFNIMSALVDFGVALTAAKSGKVSVGVIAPYIAQVRLVRALMQDYREAGGNLDVACSTVHQFQGSERDVIVFDTVESFPKMKPGVLTSRNENGSVDRLVNVAVTRARGKFVCVSNAAYWENKDIRESNAFKRLTTYQRLNNKFVSSTVKNLLPELMELDYGPNIYPFLQAEEEDNARQCLITEIENAKKRVLISLPDGNLVEPFATTLAQALKQTENNHVNVFVKCFNQDDLPEAWRKLTWQSDDALFPLVVIDDEICWYGIPESGNRIPSNKVTGLGIKYDVPIRIVGANTISMIMSLTELETRTVNREKQALTDRATSSVSGDDSGKGASGLGKYLSQRVKCPECKRPMVIARGRQSGKYYLKCSRPQCKGMAYIDPYMANNYLYEAKVRCPNCGGMPEAKVGRFGFYIRCNCGQNFLPNQI